MNDEIMRHKLVKRGIMSLSEMTGNLKTWNNGQDRKWVIMNYETADLMMTKLCQLTCNALGQAGFMPTDEELPAFAEWVQDLTQNQFCAVCDVLGIEEITNY